MTPLNILLLYKVSTYQHYQDSSEDSRPDASEIDRFRETHDAHYATLEVVENLLNERKVPYQKARRGQVDDYTEFDVIITVGGDGTFLEGASYITDQKILGVNSDPKWSVGKLCLANRDTISDYLDDILNDQFNILKLNRLSVTFKGKDEFYLCTNDILVAHSNPASLSRYILSIGDIHEEQRSSGIWFSTAAGSTGAIKSAGGDALELDAQEIQYMPRELYKGWREGHYQLTGGVLEKNSVIELRSLMAEGMLFIDGSHRRVPFAASDVISIFPSKFPLLMIQRKNSEYVS